MLEELTPNEQFLDNAVQTTVSPRASEKVYLLDLRSNTARLIFGDPCFHGREVPDGVISPQMIVEAIHPDDMPDFLEAIERAATISDDGEIYMSLRAYQADGSLRAFCQRAVPAERDTQGRVTVLRIECHAKDR